MSNSLSIAAVTAILSRILLRAAQSDIGEATVTTVEPSSISGVGSQVPRANIFLYQVTPNPAWRNADLPMRRHDGELIQRPRAAVDLHYLITFYGDESHFQPQRMLGNVVRALHSNPILTPDVIQNEINNITSDSSFDFLKDSDLAGESELLKFTPISLSIEELSKLWSVFFQTPYRLSVAYMATVVLIDGKEPEKTAPPVEKRSIYVTAFRQPVIEKVLSLQFPGGPIVEDPILASSTLIVRGKQLRGDVTELRIGGEDLFKPNKNDISETQISIDLKSLPPDHLRPGVSGVQVVHKMMMGIPPVEHSGIESNVAAFILRPTIANVEVSGHAVTVHMKPVIGKSQRVVLILRENKSIEPKTFTFIADPRKDDLSSIGFEISNEVLGNYFVSVQVDGALSPTYAKEIQII